MKSRLINVGFNEFRHIRFWALSIVLCGLLIGAFIPAFKVIGMVTVTDEGLYTRCEDSQPFRRIGPERITIPGTGNILSELYVFMVGDYAVYVEHDTMIEQPHPVRTTTEDGITVIASGILITPTVIAYQWQERDDRQHYEGSSLLAIKPPEFVCVPPGRRLRVIRV